jgi:hypothetical protein
VHMARHVLGTYGNRPRMTSMMCPLNCLSYSSRVISGLPARMTRSDQSCLGAIILTRMTPSRYGWHRLGTTILARLALSWYGWHRLGTVILARLTPSWYGLAPSRYGHIGSASSVSVRPYWLGLVDTVSVRSYWLG